MKHDAVVVGSGPNGLAAAIRLAQNGLSVTVLEAADTPGGGLRSSTSLTISGVTHDVCSAIHPLAASSPYFSTLHLERFGLEWITAPASLAHPFDDGTAAALFHSVEETADTLDAEDRRSYIRLFSPLVKNWQHIAADILGPLKFPRHPLMLARFGLNALLPASWLASLRFKNKRARGIIAGLAAHSMLRLNAPATSAIGLVLGTIAHTQQWVIPRGGSQSIARALIQCLESLGGKVITGHPVRTMSDIPGANLVLFDLTPAQILKIMGDKLPHGYRRGLQHFRYGPGVFKIDYALSSPVPFKSPMARRAAVVHLGGTFEEIALSEDEVWQSRHPEKPYVLLAQQSVFDSARAPENMHALWAYCHVPGGSEFDMSGRIEDQIERFAPGFKDTIIKKHAMAPADFQRYNENYIGGDINGGAQDWRQLFTRPVVSLNPYKMPVKGMFICSSSTPPGGGVHGMCGYHAAGRALKSLE